MVSIQGRLQHKGSQTYVGHQVVLAFQERMEVGVASSASGVSKNAAPLWKQSQRRADASIDGSFTLDLPDKAQIQGPFRIQVLAPDGDILVSEEHRDLASDLNITVVPKTYSSVASRTEPFLGKRGKVTGRVLDAEGKHLVAGKQVILYGVSADAQADEAVPVMVATTDQRGYFFGDYPAGNFSRAHGVVAVGAAEPIPVRLERNQFPKNILLVVEDVEEPAKTHDCGCMSAVPRAPDHQDLANSPSTYSTDLGGGSCVDLTVPNRSLEEFSFYSVVRTTEPEIKGLTLGAARVPIGLLNNFEGLLNASGKDALSASTTPARGITQNTTKQAIGKLAKSFSPQMLKTMVSDPEGFSPRAMLTLEKVAVFQNLSEVLDVLSKTVPGRSALTAANPIDWDDTPTFYQATTIAHGHLLHFKQTWRADGYSLGDLLYSLPLAPCQKKQIAVIDWDRRERGARAEQLEAEEQLDAFLSRDRDISEIVKSTLKESMRGGSESETDSFSAGGGLGAGGEGSLGIVSASVGGVFGLSGGSGSASSSAWQKSSRTAAANSAQHLQDTTMQAASSVRSQRATVVQTLRQGESMRVQTETVVNHNHCHAITIEYFEVLRHLRVDVELADVQECLFVPLLVSRFDYHKALRWREALTLHLRNRNLLRGFGAIERYVNQYEGSDLPDGRYSQEAIDYLDGELRIAFHLTRPKDADDDRDFDPSNWSSYSPFLAALGGSSSVFNLFFAGRSPAERDRIFQSSVAPTIAEAFVQNLRFYLIGADGEYEVKLDPTLVSSYEPNTPLYVSLRPVQGVPAVPREWIIRFEVRSDKALGADSKAIVHSGSVRYRTAHMSHFLFRDGRMLNDLQPGDPTQVPTFLDRQELRNPREEDKELRSRLIAHLNEHIEYYHKAIWWRMDKERRYMLLDGYIAPNAGGRSVASVVENKLIGIVGNCLVMPVARGFHLDPTFTQDAEEPVDLLNHYAPNTPISPIRISVPTRGVFAEAVMGSCNSCEHKDESRFWRFEESPCGDEPTPIQPVSTESRRADPGNLQAKDLPAPIVAFQNVPPAPDPSGLSSALRLLGTANLFPNITGLDQNQKNALASLLGSFDTTKFMAAQAAALANEDAKLQQQKAMSQDMDKVLQTINKTEQEGGISKEDAAAFRSNVFRHATGAAERDEKLIDKPVVGGMVDAASSTNKSVRIQSNGESVEVDAAPEGGALDETDFEFVSARPYWTFYRDPPPQVQQFSGWTCWAACGESWSQGVPQVPDWSERDLVDRFATVKPNPDPTLPLSDPLQSKQVGALQNPQVSFPPVASALEMEFAVMTGKRKSLTQPVLELRPSFVAEKLRTRGLVVFVFNTDNSVGAPSHAVVCYGVGYPDGQTLQYSVMDPQTAEYKNIPVSSFQTINAIIVGWPMNPVGGGVI